MSKDEVIQAIANIPGVTVVKQENPNTTSDDEDFNTNETLKLILEIQCSILAFIRKLKENNNMLKGLNMKRKNNKEKLEDSDSIESQRSAVAEKIIMEELLNADDFNVLLKTIQEEFERTFGISTKEEEKEIE